jgi:hypothetical protein
MPMRTQKATVGVPENEGKGKKGHPVVVLQGAAERPLLLACGQDQGRRLIQLDCAKLWIEIKESILLR